MLWDEAAPAGTFFCPVVTSAGVTDEGTLTQPCEGKFGTVLCFTLKLETVFPWVHARQPNPERAKERQVSGTAAG